jgi:hypothetical protein
MDIIDPTTNKGETTVREDTISQVERVLREQTISQLESEIICEALQDFRDAMREDVNANNEEIRKSVLKELDYYLCF